MVVDHLIPSNALYDDKIRRDIVLMLSLESIDDIFRRGFARPPDRLISALIAEPSIRLMVVAPYRSWAVAAVKRILRRSGFRLPKDPNTITVHPHRLARSEHTSIAAIQRSYKALDRKLDAETRRNGFTNPTMITFHPLAGFLEAPWASKVTYYARDDWTELPSYARWHDAYRRSYELLRSRERNVVAVSQELLDRLAPTAPSLVVPNGIDRIEWTTIPEPPAWFADLPEPRLLYVGTLDERLDLEAVAALSKGFPNGSIVFAGPTPAGSPVETLNLPNLTMVGSQEREAVTGMIGASDLCLLTHRQNKLTTAMSPLKLYEYLAGGKPVISPPLRPVQGIHRHVNFYTSTNDVVDVAKQSLKVGPMSEEGRLAFIEKNSWQSRHRQVLELAMGAPTQ